MDDTTKRSRRSSRVEENQETNNGGGKSSVKSSSSNYSKVGAGKPPINAAYDATVKKQKGQKKDSDMVEIFNSGSARVYSRGGLVSSFFTITFRHEEDTVVPPANLHPEADSGSGKENEKASIKDPNKIISSSEDENKSTEVDTTETISKITFPVGAVIHKKNPVVQIVKTENKEEEVAKTILRNNLLNVEDDDDDEWKALDDDDMESSKSMIDVTIVQNPTPPAPSVPTTIIPTSNPPVSTNKFYDKIKSIVEMHEEAPLPLKKSMKRESSKKVYINDYREKKKLLGEGMEIEPNRISSYSQSKKKKSQLKKEKQPIPQLQNITKQPQVKGTTDSQKPQKKHESKKKRKNSVKEPKSQPPSDILGDLESSILMNPKKSSKIKPKKKKQAAINSDVIKEEEEEEEKMTEKEENLNQDKEEKLENREGEKKKISAPLDPGRENAVAATEKQELNVENDSEDSEDNEDSGTKSDSEESTEESSSSAPSESDVPPDSDEDYISSSTEEISSASDSFKSDSISSTPSISKSYFQYPTTINGLKSPIWQMGTSNVHSESLSQSGIMQRQNYSISEAGSLEYDVISTTTNGSVSSKPTTSRTRYTENIGLASLQALSKLSKEDFHNDIIEKEVKQATNAVLFMLDMGDEEEEDSSSVNGVSVKWLMRYYADHIRHLEMKLLLRQHEFKDIMNKYHDIQKELQRKNMQYASLERKYFESLGKLKFMGEKERIYSEIREEDPEAVLERCKDLKLENGYLNSKILKLSDQLMSLKLSKKFQDKELEQYRLMRMTHDQSALPKLASPYRMRALRQLPTIQGTGRVVSSNHPLNVSRSPTPVTPILLSPVPMIRHHSNRSSEEVEAHQYTKI